MHRLIGRRKKNLGRWWCTETYNGTRLIGLSTHNSYREVRKAYHRNNGIGRRTCLDVTIVSLIPNLPYERKG